MNNAPKPEGYDQKPKDYFQLTRPEMVAFVPESCKKILDVGCGSGGFGQTLKQTRKVEIWGVEPVSTVAAVAATRLDRVIEDIFTPKLDLPRNAFDCIIFNDVLEHVFDPGAALQYARTLLAPGGCIVASIPNIRHFPTMWALIVRGEWIYREFGILDYTHMRFFTKKSIQTVFKDAGFRIDSINGINPYLSPFPKASPRWRYFVALNAVLLGGISDMRYLQFAVVARQD
jgi:2-polyprenyl-3-methyl-5-hydroxy-6-metoxy-1,4-benzoquinol methylase